MQGGAAGSDGSLSFLSIDSSINSQLRLLWVSAGAEDTGTFGVSRDLKTWLKSKGIEHKSIETPGAHTWMVWRRNLTELVPLLFQARN
jgi:enterochelin esterase-like enzyme